MPGNPEKHPSDSQWRLRSGAGFRNHQKTSSRDGGVLSEVEKSMADVVAGRPVMWVKECY